MLFSVRFVGVEMIGKGVYFSVLNVVWLVVISFLILFYVVMFIVNIVRLRLVFVEKFEFLL